MLCISKPLALVALFVAATAHAVPMTLDHQGRLTDAVGMPIEGSQTIGVGLYDAEEDGTQRFFESQLLDLRNGHYSMTLGLQTGNALDAADLAGAVWLEVSVNSVEMPRTLLSSAPYAISAQVAETLTAGAVVALGEGSTVDGQALASTLDITAAVADSCADTTYSETCSDWAVTGWDSIADCRTDGRWHRYATTTGTWDDHALFVDFHNASKAGADTKMRMGLDWYNLSIRSNDDPNIYVWMFITELGRHTSFYMKADGQMWDLRLGSTSNASTNANFYDGSLGNWHHFSYSYAAGVNTADESEYGGISFWARY